MAEMDNPVTTALGSSRREMMRVNRPGRVPTILTVILLSLITLYGGWLRAWHIDRQSLWLDEGVSIIHAQAIVDHGYPLLPNRRVSWDAAPVHYLMSVPVGLMSNIHLAGRLFPLLAGTASMLLMFWVVRSLSKSRIHALFATVLMCVSMYEIAWSRQARIYPFLQSFMLAAIGCTYRFGDTRKLRYLVMGFFFAIVAVLTHRAGYVLAIFLVTYALLNIPSSWKVAARWRDLVTRRFLLAVLLLVSIVTIVVMVPSHSNLGQVVSVFFSRSEVDYARHYGFFLVREMGFLLPLGVLGMVLSSVWWPTKAIPLVLSTVVFFLVISYQWQYFSFRYAFPLFPLVFLFAAVPFVIPVAREWAELSVWWRIVRCCLFGVFGVSLLSGDIVFAPRDRYMLGYTEPQPEWKEAYDLILRREREAKKMGIESPGLVTVSALPLFHDIYLGSKVGTKYYLPVSFTGHPKDQAGVESYVAAHTVQSLHDLLGIKGYLILDDFGLRMLLNKDIQTYLAIRTPNAVLKHEYNVFIWVLDGKPLGPKSHGR